METGQKTTQTSNKRLNIDKTKRLSIQISLSGLSFSILDSAKKSIELLDNVEFDKKLTPFEVLQKLKEHLDKDDAFDQDFDNVLIIYDNELSSLVPKSLFDENHLADYLKFNSKILKSDYITYDTIHINDSVNVYVPFVNINNYIFERFGEFEYKHLSTVFISSVLNIENLSTTPLVHINVSKCNFNITVSKSKKLMLYNAFEYETKEDFIYYILFVFEQLNLDPEHVLVSFTGDINKNDDRFAIAYKYIRHVRIMEPNYGYSFSTAPKLKQNNYILLNSF